MTAREGDGGARLAPVTYLPGAAPVEDADVRWAIPLQSAHASEDESPDESEDATAGVERSLVADEADIADAAAAAEEALAKRLRRSALSEREARAFLLQKGIDIVLADAVVERFTNRGWIDDAVLAEQLVYAGTSRKGQGRRAIAQTLSARGIARDVVDDALAALPDDDDERALEYARTKAHGLRSYDLDTAMRRLMGQLARRGYSGSVASSAARTALTEQRGSGGVQFR